jgi:hypothetical protein
VPDPNRESVPFHLFEQIRFFADGIGRGGARKPRAGSMSHSELEGSPFASLVGQPNHSRDDFKMDRSLMTSREIGSLNNKIGECTSY